MTKLSSPISHPIDYMIDEMGMNEFITVKGLILRHSKASRDSTGYLSIESPQLKRTRKNYKHGQVRSHLVTAREVPH